MYSGLKGVAKQNGFISNQFDISIGLRQGCNLSPYLFNIFVNDIPELLQAGNCDPAHLNNTNINALLYADDMLLLSTSEQGLQKAINILQTYCKKWQLVVNQSKTKIMVFNKNTPTVDFKYQGIILETVQQYAYLGIVLHKSGSFTTAIKTLADKASKAYYMHPP